MANWGSKHPQLMSRRKIVAYDNSDELVYFLEISKICEEGSDLHDWFLEASKGNFPAGFKYHSGTLIYTKKGKTMRKVLYKDPGKDLVLCSSLIRKSGIRTQADHDNDEKKYYDNYKKGWGNVKKDKDKTVYINRYIRDLMEKHNLTSDQIRDIRHDVFSNLSSGNLNSQNVAFENGKILSIDLDAINRLLN